MQADVLIIGAGVAGLNAARVARDAGATPVVLEASGVIGGRVRSEVVDGFTVDLGFQVLNPAYPALRQAIDVDRLALGDFGRGVAARTDDALIELMDPIRVPTKAAAALRCAARDPRGTARLVRWVANRTEEDKTLERSLGDGAVRGVWRSLLQEFLSGVLGDDTGSSSSRYTRGLVGWFLLGTPGLPAQGMAALPAQLLDRSRAEVHSGVRVRSVDREGSGWTVRTDGDSWRARSVVVATDPGAAADLLDLPRPAPARGLATWWFAAPEPPTRSDCLHIQLNRRGPVVNTAVVSNAQPAYAPAGRHLVQASTLWSEGRQPQEAEVRRHAEAIYGRSASDWTVVATHVLPRALTAVSPAVITLPVEAGPGLYVATDSGEASLQGALRRGALAGRRAVGR